MILLDTALQANMATPESVIFPSWVINALYVLASAIAGGIIWMGRYIITTNKRNERHTENLMLIVKENTTAMVGVSHSTERLVDLIESKLDKTDTLISEFRDEFRRTA
jgi:hypothetical protein